MTKNLHISIIIILFAGKVSSQSISGRILDSLERPIEYSAIALLNLRDSTIYKGIITSGKGDFYFEKIVPGNYILKISVIGYIEKYSEAIKLDTLINLKIPDIILAPSKDIRLNEINITAVKKTIEFKNGNITVNVANSALAMGNTVYDLLVKLPGVMVDNEKISIQGREGVKIMINGRMQQLTPKQIVNLLLSMSASTVEKIEILKNPPVKFDASGTAGIINIKTKKTGVVGSSGNISTTGTQGVYPRGETALSLNYKGKNFLLFGDLNSEYGNYTSNFTFNREITYNSAVTILNEKNVATEIERDIQCNLGFDLNIGKRNTIGAKVTQGPSSSDERTKGNTELSDQSSGYQNMEYDKSILNTWNYMNYNINAEHSFDTAGTKISFSADYSPNWDLYLGKFDHRFLDGGQEVTDPIIFKTTNREDVDIWSSRLDFEKKLKGDALFETGIKATHQNFKKNYLFENKSVQNGDYYRDTGYSNKFNYRESILAGYINFGKEIGDFEFQCGLRAENTDIFAGSREKNFAISRKYFNLFPNLSIGFEPGEKHSFEFSYNRRINRPDCYAYYPFKSIWSNVLITDMGNPNLLPEYSNTFEFTHTFNSSISQAIAYSRISNFMLGYTTQNDSTKEITITNGNLKGSNTIGYTLTGELKIKNWWTVNCNATASYFSYRGKLQGLDYDASAFSYYAYLSSEFAFKKTNKLEMSGQYFGPVLMGVFNPQPRWALNLAYKKTFFNEKLNLVFGVNDIFYTLIERNKIRFQNQKMDLRETNDSRRFKIAVSYSFGRIKVERRETNSNEDEKEKLKH
jgi:iron complex outermembrane receptor protein